MVTSSDRRIGSLVAGRWLLTRVLGSGGTATVYEAETQDGQHRRVAIKIVHAALSADSTIRLRLLREAHITQELDHPGVVRIFEVGSDEVGVPFLVMELLEGQSLEQRRRETGGRLPVPVVVTIAEQALAILAAAHRHSVLHRDLKPGNLFATHDGRLKLLDFGIADSRGLDPRLSANTERGLLMGTPAFMPPEQAVGRWEDVDHRADLWALGATLFTLVTGRTVHDARDKSEQLRLAMSAPARPVATVMSDLPAPLANAIDGALAFDREARWQSAEEMLAALRGAATPRRAGTGNALDHDTTLAAADNGLQAAVAAIRPWRHRSPRRALLVATALALTAGLVALGLWSRQSRLHAHSVRDQTSARVLITTPIPTSSSMPMVVTPVVSPLPAPPAAASPSAPRPRPTRPPSRSAPHAAPAVVESSEPPPPPSARTDVDPMAPELRDRR